MLRVVRERSPVEKEGGLTKRKWEQGSRRDGVEWVDSREYGVDQTLPLDAGMGMGWECIAMMYKK